ncbi:MAG: cytochrome-c peroxidase [Nitrosomonadales bacterium]|nr:cytochrome-c peroxidase [Nitrosomonadales bacterium]
MLKRSRWLVLPLLVLAAGVVTHYILETAQDAPDARATSPVSVAPVAMQEPISPIPLEIKLDARKVALGKRLFHDPRLSSDDSISCAHCHNLANGGMDSLPRSFGIGGKEGNINAPTVFNSGFNASQFWDGRAATLEEQVEFPMMHPCEMGSTWAEVIGKLELDADYRRDFASIYPEGVNESAVKNAIATFERSLITPNSKFDRYLRGDRHALNREELAGYELFKNLGCISCHQGMNVGGNMYEKIGLFSDYFMHRGNVQSVDYGRYNVSKNEEHRYEFRVPPLRNVALTAPYFHDASAATLERAVAMMGQYQLGVELSKDEIDKIVSFLATLTGVYQAGADK